jgi:hypothetical protein
VSKDEKTSEVLTREVELSKRSDAVEALLVQYTNRATRLQLLPSSAHNARGRELACELVSTTGASGPAKALSIDLLEALKPTLAELKVWAAAAAAACLLLLCACRRLPAAAALLLLLRGRLSPPRAPTCLRLLPSTAHSCPPRALPRSEPVVGRAVLRSLAPDEPARTAVLCPRSGGAWRAVLRRVRAPDRAASARAFPPLSSAHALPRCVWCSQGRFTARLHEAQQELLKLQDQLDRSEQAKQVRALRRARSRPLHARLSVGAGQPRGRLMRC